MKNVARLYKSITLNVNIMHSIIFFLRYKGVGAIADAHQVLLRFVDGRPVTAVTIDFLA